MDLKFIDSASPVPKRMMLPFAAMVLGLFSGPTAVGLAGVVSLGWPDAFARGTRVVINLNDVKSWIAFGTVVIGALCLGVVARLRCNLIQRDNTFAEVAIIAPIVWAVAVCVFFVYVMCTWE